MWDVWKLFAGHTAGVGDHHGVKVTPGAHQSQLHEMQMGRIMAAHRHATVTAAKRQRPGRLYLTTVDILCSPDAPSVDGRSSGRVQHAANPRGPLRVCSLRMDCLLRWTTKPRRAGLMTAACVSTEHSPAANLAHDA